MEAAASETSRALALVQARVKVSEARRDYNTQAASGDIMVVLDVPPVAWISGLG